MASYKIYDTIISTYPSFCKNLSRKISFTGQSSTLTSGHLCSFRSFSSFNMNSICLLNPISYLFIKVSINISK